MDMIKKWNETIKPLECDVMAQENDLVWEIGATMVLVQRINNCNNVIFFKNKPGPLNFKYFCESFYALLLSHGIQYIRVEGNKRRYMFLLKMKKYFPKIDVVKAMNLNRNVFFIKLY